MVRAIREFLERTGVKVGFKPAGGIRTAKDSLAWLSLMKEELGNDYVKVFILRLRKFSNDKVFLCIEFTELLG